MKQSNNATICRLLRNRGFTLIELLIYTAILSVALVFTGEYLFSIGQARLSNSARIEVAKNAELLMTKLKSDLIEATSISIPSDSNPADNLQITLRGGEQISYQLEDSLITRTSDAETNDLIDNQVQASNLSFQKIANSGGKETIQMKFRLESVAQMSGGRTVSENFQTTVSRR